MISSRSPHLSCPRYRELEGERDVLCPEVDRLETRLLDAKREVADATSMIVALGKACGSGGVNFDIPGVPEEENVIVPRFFVVLTSIAIPQLVEGRTFPLYFSYFGTCLFIFNGLATSSFSEYHLLLSLVLNTFVLLVSV